MPSNKNSNVKNGFILVYTLLLGTICITLALFCLIVTSKEETNLKHQLSLSTNVDSYQKYRELLLTNFSLQIKSSVQTLTLANVRTYLNNIIGSTVIQETNCFVSKYNLSKNQVSLTMPYDDNYNIMEIYEFKIVSSKLLLKYLLSSYVPKGV